MLHLKQSTATQSVLLGPFVDEDDGKTSETGLTIANTDIRLSANGGNMFAKTSGGGTHDEIGYYQITLDATDTATVGRLQVVVAVAGALDVYHEFQVLEEEVYDDLYGAAAVGYLKPVTGGNDIDVTATGAAGIDWGNVENKTTVNDLTQTDIQLVDTCTTNTDMVAAAPTVAAIADAVWDEVMSGHVIDGSYGLGVQPVLTGSAAGGAATTVTLDGSASAVADIYNGAHITILNGTGIGQSRRIVDYAVTTKIATVEPAWIVNPVSGDDYIVHSFGNIDLRTATQTSVDAIEADTNELQTDDIPGTLGTPAGASLAADLVVIDDFVDGLESTIGVAGAGLGDLGGMSTGMQTEVNNEVLDVMTTDTFGEPAQGAPGVTISMEEKISWLYKFLRNRTNSTATLIQVFDDDGTTVGHKSTISDDATTFERGEFVTGL